MLLIGLSRSRARTSEIVGLDFRGTFRLRSHLTTGHPQAPASFFSRLHAHPARGLLLSKRRDMEAAKRFFCRAMRQHGAPRVITLDGYAASHRAVAKLKEAGTLPGRVQVRSCKYLNNVVEQDHRRIKQRVRPMFGFKRFETAAVRIRGIELAAKINKHQFNLKAVTSNATTAPEIWAAVLAV